MQKFWLNIFIFISFIVLVNCGGKKSPKELLSDAKKTTPDKLTACVLKRPRHDKIVNSLNEMGVKINFITDGDVSGVISVARTNFNNDFFIGIGGGPEGVLALSLIHI